MLVASLGTPFEIQTEDTILFIEDIGEKPFRIDRMLMQLRLAGKLDKVRGFVFGEMLDCAPPQGRDIYFAAGHHARARRYDVPIVYGLKSGHVTSGNITLPIGVQAEMSGRGGKCEFEDFGSGDAIALSIQQNPLPQRTRRAQRKILPKSS